MTKHITYGTDNVLADLGVENAEEIATNIGLAIQINKAIKAQKLTQVQAAVKLGVSQPKVSAIKNYKLDGFSTERLMSFLVALDKDVEIRIKRAPEHRPGRVSVAANP